MVLYPHNGASDIKVKRKGLGTAWHSGDNSMAMDHEVEHNSALLSTEAKAEFMEALSQPVSRDVEPFHSETETYTGSYTDGHGKNIPVQAADLWHAIAAEIRVDKSHKVSENVSIHVNQADEESNG